MMKPGKYLVAALVIGAFFFALTGCQKQEGPAEQAGKKLDNALDQTGQKIENAGEKIQDATDGKN